MNAISMKNFSCYYKNKKEYITALDGIDLDIEAGELVALVGESGSGKSTFIKACLGMADYYDGDLFINGNDVKSLNLKTANMSLVRQDIALYPHLNVYENIAFPLRLMRTPQSEVEKRVIEMAKIIGMELFLTRKPKQLSGGQQQRIAIARALVKNPNFLFFDEPFSNIGSPYKLELRELVKKLHKTFRPTIVFVTHDMAEAFGVAERVIVLENGKIVESGTPDYLRENGESELVRVFMGR